MKRICMHGGHCLAECVVEIFVCKFGVVCPSQAHQWSIQTEDGFMDKYFIKAGMDNFSLPK